MEVGQLIRNRRTELGYTQKYLAELVGTTEATVSRWESGDIANMKRDKIAALARALRIPPAVLMDWEEYDREEIERNDNAYLLYELAQVSDIKNIRICYNLLKQLEGKE